MTHDFEDFWRVYPKRPNNPKQPARLAWEAKVRAGVLPPQDQIIRAVDAYRAYVIKEKLEPKFICHTRTWISQERWEEWLTPEPTPTSKPRNIPLFMVPVSEFMGLGFRLYESCEFTCRGSYVSVVTDSTFVAERAVHGLIDHMERILRMPAVVSIREKV